MLRQNPAVQEFRATVRDYSQALNNLKAIVDHNEEPVEIDDITDVKRKFKLAK
jgi:hypothetical protein